MRTLQMRIAPVLACVLSTSFAHAQAPAAGEPAAQPAEPAAADATAAATTAEPATTRALPSSKTSGDDLERLLDQPGGLTSDEVARQAAEYTRRAIVAQEDYNYAKAKKAEVIWSYTPSLTLTASYTRKYTPRGQNTFGQGSLVGTTAAPGPITAADPLFAIDTSSFNFTPLPNQWYLNAGLVVPISDYLLNFSQALHGAEAALNSARLNERAARLNAAANARLAYYEWVRAKLRVAEVQNSIQRAQAQLENLQRLQAGGRASRSDVLRQEAFVAQSELNLRRAATNEAVARESMYVQMVGGQQVETPQFQIGENILGPGPHDEDQLSEVNALQQEAMQSRLEIRALDETKYALSQQSSVQRTQGYPRVEGFGNLTYANPNPVYIPPENKFHGSWDVGVRAVWTINDLGRTHAAAKATDAEAAKIEAQKQEIVDSLRTEVLTAHRSILEARLARESARRGVEAAQAAYADQVQLFGGGRSTSLDVLQSENALITARMDLIDAYIALRQAQVRLDHAIGRDIQDAEGKPKAPGN